MTMASESIRFDFLSSGADKLAGDFRRTGDNAAAAARGAKVLQEVIKTLGDKENRTAAESANLAKALRLTGDAEDRAAARALGADIAIRRLDDAMKDSSKNASGAKAGFAGLVGEITGFGAAAGVADSKGSLFARALAGVSLASGVLEPALAGVVVVAGGLAAGLASAGAGLGVFGLVAKSVYSQASTAATKYATAQQQLDLATTKSQRVAALKAEQAALYGLSPPVKTLTIELGTVKSQWKAFTDAAAPGVVGVIGQGLGLLPKVLAAMKPFLAPAEKALSGIIAQLNTGLSSSGFKSFIDTLAANSGPAITKIGQAIGNVAVGLGGIIRAFLPVSQVMLSGLDKITAKFREWGSTLSRHSGFQSLMQTFRTEAPQALAILKNLGEVLLNVGKAVFGLSTFSNSRVLLAALLPLSGVMASLSRNTGLVRAALYALAAVKIGQQFSWVTDAWKGIVKFAAAAEGATIAETIAAAATRAWGLAMDALPWVALAAAVVAAALLIIKYHTQIWHFMIRVWNDILQIIAGVWGWVKTHWPLLLGILTGPVGLAILWIVQHFGAITGAVKTVLGAVKTAWDAAWNTLKAAFRVWVVDGILTPLGWIIHGAAAAFGWVPIIGGKLKGAAKAFDQFRDNVNKALGGINGRTVNVGVAMTSSSNPYPGGISGRAAAGMYVAAGRPGVDDQLILAQRGELVVPTAMVRAGAVDHLRGQIPGFAAGGAVGVNVAAAAPGYKAIEAKLMASVMTLAQAFAKAAAAASAAAGSLGGPVSASAAQAQAYARSRLGAYGWNQDQMMFLIPLWNQESGWNRLARNPSSGAYGIPQALPASKMGAAANPPTSSAAAQINWGLGYIKGRYGSPASAEAHEHAYNWYDRGGWLKPGLTLAYNGTGRPEMVIPPGRGGTGHLILEIRGTGHGTFDAFLLKWIRENVRVKGGGDVQTAFGR
jgi:hypothetical protein